MLARLLNGHGVVSDRRQVQAAAQQPTIGMGIGAHAALANGREGPQLGDQASLPIKEFVGAVALQPGLQHLQLLRIPLGVGQGHLVAAPEAFQLFAI